VFNSKPADMLRWKAVCRCIMMDQADTSNQPMFSKAPCADYVKKHAALRECWRKSKTSRGDDTVNSIEQDIVSMVMLLKTTFFRLPSPPT
jgi:hypothetical protein